MKKYLIMGVAALSMCTAFTSCSHDVDILSPEELNAQQAQKVIKTYEQAFINTFGEPAPDQDWGFGSSSAASRTRGNYANANEWGAPEGVKPQSGWKVPPVLTAGQILRVTRYFQTHPDLGYNDPGWENFFVQQVYKGHDNVLSGYSPEIYRSAATKATEAANLVASNEMDHLTAGATDHINNFNGGDAGVKTVLETGQPIGGKSHDDKINLMVNSTTVDFMYWNSDGSIGHGKPYVALVSASVIDEWGDRERIGEKVYSAEWNRSFLGCDYELRIGDDRYAGTNLKLSEQNVAQGLLVDGEYVEGFPEGDYIYNGSPVRYLLSDQNQYGGDFVELGEDDLAFECRGDRYDDEGNVIASNDLLGKALNTAKIDEMLAADYLPVSGSGLKKWVKLQAVADGYYSDWIVTLTEATKQDSTPDPDPDPDPDPTPEPSDGDLRIIAEDLTATTANDFDFNDIVFDVYFGSPAHIVVQAAGGTLPLRIKVSSSADSSSEEANADGWREVHDIFGQPTNIMINTQAERRYPGRGTSCSSVSVPLDYVVNSNNDAKNITIEVQKTINGQRQWVELGASTGVPAAKIAVGCDFNWCKERVEIEGQYPNFKDWVTGTYKAAKWWE